jgi:hypothetical protein
VDRNRWIVLGILVALLAGIQHGGLERTVETRTEAPMRQFKGLPAGDILPTYIASLFFGALRAVAVDVLWIQLKKVEEEKRWYEAREILKLISYFQPRNPEVWAHLGWHSAYNIANGFTDKEKAWEWVAFGLGWYRRGIRTIPDEPYLMSQLAYTLWHKPSWRDGEVDAALLRRIEAHEGLQADLPVDGAPAGVKRSAFELAIPWLERSRDVLLTRAEGNEKTQMGLYLYPSTMDGFVRRCMILQASWLLEQGRDAEARAWFGRADAHVKAMLRKTYPERISPIFEDYSKLYDRYPALLDLRQAAIGGDPGAGRAYLKALQDVLAEFGLLEEGLWWRAWDPEAPVNALKRKLTGGRDLQEYNDAPFAATLLNPGDLALADLEPAGLDVDCYSLRALAPDRKREVPPKPLQFTVKFGRPEGSGAAFRASVLDPSGKVLGEVLPDAKGEARFSVDRYGVWILRVEPLPGPAPADSRYRVQYSVEER